MEELPVVTVERLNSEGEGVGKLPSGKVVFVPRTAPGDRVVVRVDEEKKRWARGRGMEWKAQGPAWRDPPCPLYSRCDGCAVQHLVYSEQVAWKSRWVGETLRRIGGLDLADPEVVPSPEEFRYRNRITLTLRRLRGGRIVAGFRELGKPGRVVDMKQECLLPEPKLLDVWGALRGEWGQGGRHLPEGGELRLTLTAVRDGVSVMVRGGSGDGQLRDIYDKVPGLVSVWRQDPGGARRLVAGAEVLAVDWGDRVLKLRGGGFLQVNRGAAELLQDHILEAAGDVRGREVVDAYSGPGLMGMRLAERGARVTGIDVAPGVLDLSGGAEPGYPSSSPEGVIPPPDPDDSSVPVDPGFRLVVGRVEEQLESLLPAHLVILNPPRGGLSPEVPEVLNRTPPDRLVYVSCDPATLARDLKELVPVFAVKRVRSFDLFPQTAHVETLTTLERTSQVLQNGA